MEFLATDVHLSCLMLYAQSKISGTFLLAYLIAEVLIIAQYPPTGLLGLANPYMAHRNGALKPLFPDILPLSFNT